LIPGASRRDECALNIEKKFSKIWPLNVASQHGLGHETFREPGESVAAIETLGSTGSPATGAEQTFQRACAISGIVCPLLFFGGLLLCGFLPPLWPGASAIEIASHYQQHATAIRFGAALILLASMFYIAYSGAIYGQVRRIPGSGHTAPGVALAGGAVAAVTGRSRGTVCSCSGCLRWFSAFSSSRTPSGCSRRCGVRSRCPTGHVDRDAA